MSNIRNYKWEKAPDIYCGDNSIKRFLLGVSGANPLICFGINPSTATEKFADKTLHMVEQIAKRNGYDGWIMLNIYPLRSTDPNGLPEKIDVALHSENIKYITELLRERELTLWAGWGKPIMIRPYLLECLRDIHAISTRNNCRWVAFGKYENGLANCTTVDNHPRHPSRLPLAAISKEYDVTHYFKP